MQRGQGSQLETQVFLRAEPNHRGQLLGMAVDRVRMGPSRQLGTSPLTLWTSVMIHRPTARRRCKFGSLIREARSSQFEEGHANHVRTSGVDNPHGTK